ncbi:MAG: AMP-binding protein [Myxococcales bacterium]|nr:AMP-binding protein [Myxococcales bacterium]
MGFQIGQVLRQGALRHGERVACVLVDAAGDGPDRTLTYGELDAASRSVARALLSRGLPQGARVALSAENGDGFLAGFFGACYAGCTVVPIPILSAPAEVALRVQRASCAAALVDEAREPLVQGACPKLGVLRVDALVTTAAGTNADLTARTCDGDWPTDVPVDLDSSADALLLFTSGTTGGAKAARITHASLLTHTAALVHHTLQLSADDVVLGALPFTHSFGLRMSVLAPLYAGASVLVFPRFDRARTLAALDAGRVTWAPAVPTMFAAWTGTPGGGPVARGLRSALSAGAPLPAELRRRAAARLGCPVRQGYGLTEATFSTVDDGRVGDDAEHVGPPVWGVELRIRDAEGHDLPSGSEGEVWVRGANVMAGYLDDDEATAAVFEQGWLRTGDLGRLDAHGQLVLVDRLKDLILRGGANVYPSEVEDALSLHPSVLEVAVIGRPDDYYGEEVVAVVVPRGEAPSTDELTEHARLHLAKNKLPAEYVFTDALPLGPSGKVLKRTLRERYGARRVHQP